MKPSPAPRASSCVPVAIIGMACIFPRAPDLATFWNNILSGVDAIGEPVEAWGARRYLEAGRIKTQLGGFLNDLYRFDPFEFGIMPSSIDGGETDHYLALRVARDALADAGYLRADADHRDTGIVLGHSAYLHRGQVTVIQNNIVLDQTIDIVKAALPQLDDAALAGIRSVLQRKLPASTADNAPGLVPNMMTGRIANRLDLRGPNYVLDAACASSLLAVAAAIDELATGRSRMMMAGGVNATLPADVSASFTQLGALSARGKVRPFETGSDGTLLGEGLGIVVLKRLDDAVADGDRIYAVVRGVGQSSDGRGTGLLAPSLEGESLAMRRAYDATGIDPASIGVVEAHGTGIPLGDRTEIAALKSIFGERRTPMGVKALGSVKSMISHCIPAAGIASLIKMSLALHHRTLPPTLCDRVNAELGVERTPFYINTATAPWIARLDEPRRAGVNAFGFGGINAHAIVEQAPIDARKPARLTAWPAELCVVSADSSDAMLAKLDRLDGGLARNPHWRIADVAAALAQGDAAGAHRLAIVARDLAGLKKSIAQARRKVQERDGLSWVTRSGAAYAARRMDGKLAFLFPGEGSQYPGMFADLALCFDSVSRWLDFWHGLYDLPVGHTRTDIVFPSAEIGFERRAQLETRLHHMDVGSEAVFIGGMAMYELFTALGVEADAMVGHSSGESAAFCASGANRASTPAELAACISRHYAIYDELLQSGRIPVGALLAVGALPAATVMEHIASSSPEVVVAMDNCSNQLVLYGPPDAIVRLQKALARLGGVCIPLPFDRGYHTPVFAGVSEAFLRYYKDIRLGKPKVPLYSCASAAPFPATPAAVRQLAAAQWSRQVRFRETVTRMHDDGVRFFVEIGPSANLTSFVNDILAGRDFAAVASNVRRKSGVEQVLSVLGQLYVAGKGVALERLFDGRNIDHLDLDAPASPRRLPPLLDNTMPMVRLTDADREAVRRLVAQGLDIAASASEVDGVADVRGDTPVPAIHAADDNPSTHASDSPTPLIDEIVERDESHVLARCELSLANDRFIRHHVLSGPVSDTDPALLGLACVPLMVSLEIMAEACALLAGHTGVSLIENVKALDWVALHENEIVLDVRAEVLDRQRSRFSSQIATSRGVAVSAEFGFAPDWKLPALGPLDERRPWGIEVPSLYTTGHYGMFHGPVFQTMREIQAWDHGGIDVALGEVSLDGFFAHGHTPQLVLNPALLDAMGQVVPCWLVQYAGPEFHSFPSTIGRIELYESCPTNRSGVAMRARQRPVDSAATDVAAPRLWQLECIDGDGRVLMRTQDMVNGFFQVAPTYHAARTNPLLGWLGGPAAVASPPGSSVWEVPMIPEWLCAQSGGICMDVLAHALLAAEERHEWRALNGHLKRRREWLFGRAALKEAVRHWVYQETGHLLYPTDVVVRHDDRGAPYVDGWWYDSLIAAPYVSLSHAGNTCLAAVAAPDQPVGIDLEELGRIKQPELIVDNLAQEERSLVDGLRGVALDERVLRLWCAKEAAAKCLGIGLRGQPEAFRITSADTACESLRVDHEAGAIGTHVVRQGSRIIAVATPAAPELHG